MGFINLFKAKMRQFFVWLAFWLGMVLLPIRQAGAFTEIITASVVFLIKLTTAIATIYFLSGGVLQLAQVFLNWASSPTLVGAVTRNEFVQQGWAVIRDFSNMFFILIMVIIGVATALRIKQYEVRKALPRLIAIALLINFSPVICGLAIDAANIITNFFLTAGAAGFGQTINEFQTQGNRLVGDMKGADTRGGEGGLAPFIFRTLFTIVLNLFGAFVLFILGLLFLIRNLVLWVLVILSPLAFLSYVLPGTKKAIFDRWRHEFVNWTFIGVGAAFFIYLSRAMVAVQANIWRIQPATQTLQFGGATLAFLIVQAVPFIFLLIGYTVVVSTSAMGAKAVISLGQRVGDWRKTRGGQLAMGRLRQGLGKAAEPYKKVASDWAARVSKEEKIGLRDRGGVVRAPLQRLRQTAAKQVLKGTTASDASQIEKLTEKYDKMTGEQRELEFKTAKTSNEKIAAVLAKAKNQEKTRDEDVREVMELALRTNDKGITKKALQINPKMAQELWQRQWDEFHGLELEAESARKDRKTKLESKRRQQKEEQQYRMERLGMWMKPEDEAKYGTFERKMVGTMKEKDIPNMSEDYVKSVDAQKIMHEFWRGSQIATAARTFEQTFIEAFNQETLRLDQITDPRHPDYLPDSQFQKLVKYLRGSPAQDFSLINFESRRRPPGGGAPGGAPGGGAPGGGAPGGGAPGGGAPGGGTIIVPPSRGHVKMTSRQKGGVPPTPSSRRPETRHVEPERKRPDVVKDKTEGWKLHLTIAEKNREIVNKALQEMRQSGLIPNFEYKMGRSGGQEGKDFTIYVGHKDDTDQVAKAIELGMSDFLEEPGADAKSTDIPFTPKVWGRFDISRSLPEFHQYGSPGIPHLKDDVGNLLYEKDEQRKKQLREASRKRADKILKEKLGEFYTGSQGK